mgnify:CR=1 FL=1
MEKRAVLKNYGLLGAMLAATITRSLLMRLQVHRR